jgi:hypothetical protein
MNCLSNKLKKKRQQNGAEGEASENLVDSRISISCISFGISTLW